VVVRSGPHGPWLPVAERPLCGTCTVTTEILRLLLVGWHFNAASFLKVYLRFYIIVVCLFCFLWERMSSLSLLICLFVCWHLLLVSTFFCALEQHNRTNLPSRSSSPRPFVRNRRIWRKMPAWWPTRRLSSMWDLSYSSSHPSSP
jgi:hypothetical protein